MTLLVRLGVWLEARQYRAELAAILLLTGLWALYFWRVLTPSPADQVSLPEGDFSSQFLAFGAYQSQRLLAGQIPLWSPYNYAGHPFLADTQAAVFYPPRLLTIIISHWLGGWSYGALQAEVIAHYWLASVLMYLFVRAASNSRTGGIVSGIAFSYGGYLTGYPALQLAVLESGVWLPLGLVGIWYASHPSETNTSRGWRNPWLTLTIIALGMSLLAGHPQTCLFLTYVLVAYFIHRAHSAKIGWKPTLPSMFMTFALGYGLAAVQIIPGLEYTRLSVRASLGFDALAGGFPFSDLVTLFIPAVFTVWSPLYVGIAVMGLAGVAAWKRTAGARFWLGVALVALGMSFGGATVLYHLAYLVTPGLSLFRGQERLAYVISSAVAVLAGLGASALQKSPDQRQSRIFAIAAALAGFAAVEILIVSQVYREYDLFPLTRAAFFLVVLGSLTWIVIGRLGKSAQTVWWSAAVVGLIAFDLFSNTMRTNWEPIPANSRMPYSDLVPIAVTDDGLFRVDGRLGLGGNFGSMVGLQDISGVSPLRLRTLDGYFSLPQYRMHQLLAVKYVFTDWQELEVPSTVLAETDIWGRHFLLHRIDNPYPRAWMTYQTSVISDPAQALGILADPAFDPLATAIVTRDPALALPQTSPTDWRVAVVEGDYSPERIVVVVDTPADGILILSEMDYPGWQAIVNEQPAEILQVDAGLRGLPLHAGEYTVEFVYRPLSVKIGALLSIGATGALIALAIWPVFARRRASSPQERAANSR